MTRYWLGVAARDHVRRGLAGGFMQLCHGKASPLRRLSPGDGIVYYSPVETFGRPERLQAFTAIGRVAAGESYLADMGGGFRPFRRDVVWRQARHAAIRPLLPTLDLAVTCHHQPHPSLRPPP